MILERKMAPEAEREWQERSDRIEAATAALSEHRWAGHYYMGDGLGVNVSLWLAPDVGFTALWSGCQGVYDRNWGSVRDENGELDLEFAFPNLREGFEGFPESLVPVPWGDRRYLLGERDFPRFCSYVNAGWEPREDLHGLFLLRCGDEARPTQGQPEVPEHCRAWLLVEPLVTEIIAVGETTLTEDGEYETRTTRIILGAGRAQGAFDGMMFFTPGGTADVVEVQRDSCAAVIEDFGANGPLPEVGWSCTTRLGEETSED